MNIHFSTKNILNKLNTKRTIPTENIIPAAGCTAIPVIMANAGVKHIKQP